MTRAGLPDAGYTRRFKSLISAIGRSLGYARRGGGKRANINSSITHTPGDSRIKNKERDR